jgi:hypothetical protein
MVLTIIIMNPIILLHWLPIPAFIAITTTAITQTTPTITIRLNLPLPAAISYVEQ